MHDHTDRGSVTVSGKSIFVSDLDIRSQCQLEDQDENLPGHTHDHSKQEDNRPAMDIMVIDLSTLSDAQLNVVLRALKANLISAE